MARRLARLDAAFAVARHVADPYAVGLKGELVAMLPPRASTARDDRRGLENEGIEVPDCCVDLFVQEADLVEGGKHVLMAYITQPKAGGDFPKHGFPVHMRALVYHIDYESGEMKIAYPCALFDPNFTDNRALMSSALSLTIGNKQIMNGMVNCKINDVYFPPEYLRLYERPSRSISDMWRILDCGTPDRGLVVGSIIKPKLDLRCWQGGDFISYDAPPGSGSFCQVSECIPDVVEAMRACVQRMCSAIDEADEIPSESTHNISLLAVP